MRCDRELEKMINNIIENDIFKDFDDKRYEIGMNKLQKLYLQYYYNTENMNVKWRVLFNLIYVEHILNEDHIFDASIKEYTNILKNELEGNEKYLKTHKGYYCDMLSYYIPYNKDNLSREEIIALYKVSYDIFKNILDKEYNERNFLCFINAKFNLYLSLENEDVVLSILNTLSSLHNNQADLMIDDMLKDIKELNINLYEKIKNTTELAV